VWIFPAALCSRFHRGLDDWIEVEAGADLQLSFDHEKTYASSEDGDGIPNILELQTCGRFDQLDLDQPARSCRSSGAPWAQGQDHPCCVQGSPEAQGQKAHMAGGTHLFIDGTSVNLSPHHLDSTEVTLLALERCVAAGSCLHGDPTHPARQALAQGADLSLPVTGLSPLEGMALCKYLGGRLPSDSEWDAAAAHCGDANARARFPWSCASDTATLPVCLEGSLVSAAANHQEAGVPCPGRLLAVGTYPAAGKTPPGGDGILFDLAGNAGEWTLPEVLDPSWEEIQSWLGTGQPVPPGVSEVHVRGGDFKSGSVLLENDFRFTLPTAAPEHLDAIWRAAERTGVRCAFSDDTQFAPLDASCPAL
jgi:formylglycine-generating enzyme required for sulfatase activity